MTKTENTLSKVFLNSWHPFLWITILIAIVYSITLFNNVVYLDDNVLVTAHYQFNSDLSNIPQAFTEDIFRTPLNHGTYYRPIDRLSFMLDAQFGEDSIIFMSHFSNIILHIIAMCLLFYFLTRLKIRKMVAFLFTLIFCIHPITTQTVSLIVGRNDSLLTIFILGSLIFFINFLNNRKPQDLIGHLSFFAIALLTKETAIVLPIFCAIYILIFIGYKDALNNYKTYLILMFSYIGIVIAWFLIRMSVLHDFVGNAKYNIIFSIFDNLASLIPAIGKIFLPFNLSVFPVMHDMVFSYGLITIAGLIIWYIFSEKRDNKLILLGLSWFLIFIFLTLLKPIDTVPEFSENRIYLPMLGFIFIILGLGWIKLPLFMKRMPDHKTEFVLMISIPIIVLFSSITFHRNQYYKDGLTFWKNATDTSPSYAFNHNNFGSMSFLNKDMVNSEIQFKLAIELNPKEPMAHNNLGLVYANQGRVPEAEQEYKKELEVNPGYDNAYYNLALLYWNQKKYIDAIINWKKILENNPNFNFPPEILQIIKYGVPKS
ncbi:MAG: tetratricopeptide repeat protein [Candidatus Staskawiczbacteria bacterium]